MVCSIKNQENHMAREACFIDGATCGICPEIAKAPLADGNQLAATDCKAQAVTKASATSNNLLSVALDVRRKEEVEVPELLPVITVVSTVGGPLIYRRPNAQFT
jgi:NADP-dependent 3-hydroxy acid dehydrogenase YdfG